MFPSTLGLHGTLSSACLGLAIKPRTALHTVRIMHNFKQAQYVEPQEDHSLLAALSQ